MKNLSSAKDVEATTEETTELVEKKSPKTWIKNNWKKVAKTVGLVAVGVVGTLVVTGKGRGSDEDAGWVDTDETSYPTDVDSEDEPAE